MQERSAWLRWARTLLGGQPSPLHEYPWTVHLQLIFAAALLAAVFETLAAALAWSSTELRQQYHAVNVLVAQRLGYPPSPMQEFSALQTFAASLFLSTMTALFLWGVIVGIVVRFVLRRYVGLSVVVTAAVVPLAVGGLLSVAVAVVQVLAGSARIVPSLAVLLDPLQVDVRWFSLASKLDVSSLVHAVLGIRLAVHDLRLSEMVIAAGVAFLLRALIIAAMIWLVARSTGL